MLELNGVSVRRRARTVLDRLSLSVAPGEACALLGKNASGKTTTLRVLAGLLRPDAGTVCLEGDDITALSAHARARRGLSFCQAERQLFERMTVAENLRLGCYPVRCRGKRALEEALASIHDCFPILRARSRQRAGSLSGGEQKLVAIARTLLGDPRYLLLDEPLLGLAPAMADRLAAALKAFQARGTAVLFTEQTAQLSRFLADSEYHLDRGEWSEPTTKTSANA